MTDGEPTCHATSEGEQLFIELYNEFKENASEEHAVRQLQGTAMDYIAQGDSRVVLGDPTGQYLHTGDACVVKIEKRGDIEQNKTEVENWQNSNDAVRDHLLRPTDWDDDYRWVVMPYLSTDVTDEQMFEMEKTFIENGLDVKDVRKPNVAVSQGRAVMVDYGRPFYEIDFTAMSQEEMVSTRRFRWRM